MMETSSDTIFPLPQTANENPFVQKIPLRTDAPASLGLRAAAFLVDYILTLLILGVAISIAMIFKSGFPTVANWIVNLGYLAVAGFIIWNWGILTVRDGQRVGQRLVGIRIIRADGGYLGYRTILLRHLLGYPLSLLCLGLGFLWIIIDPKQRGWHDKLAGTLVVRNQQ
ncbi:MAG TPA: RDD family protein [Blastocatellia bacterium]|nr:RDD family protein [Blastocatellia bacterium]